jgi:hypothetical protein
MTARLERPSADEYASFYAVYVERVPGGDIVELLSEQLEDISALLASVRPGAESHAYAAGKWTVREVVGHMVDTERVLAYRALRFARADGTPVPGFDESAYAAAGRFEERSLADLRAELEAVRRSTIALFRGLPENAWPRRGTANDAPVTVRALANIAHGHVAHHLAILNERYAVATR